MATKTHYDGLFSGVMGQEYEILKLICPLATEMSRLVGLAVAAYASPADTLNIVELGGGTGITTLSLFSARDGLNIFSIDNEPTMQKQAQKHLKQWIDEEKLHFCGEDALTALKNISDESVDIIASAYTFRFEVNALVTAIKPAP